MTATGTTCGSQRWNSGRRGQKWSSTMTWRTATRRRGRSLRRQRGFDRISNDWIQRTGISRARTRRERKDGNQGRISTFTKNGSLVFEHKPLSTHRKNGAALRTCWCTRQARKRRSYWIRDQGREGCGGAEVNERSLIVTKQPQQ
jgi:hypothetical protein